MKRRLTLLLASLSAAFMLSSCDMELASATTNSKLEEAVKKATTPVQATPTTKKPTTPVAPKPAVPPPSGGSTSGFLWKPISESTGTLAIHLPAYYNGKVSRVTVNGESGRFGGYHNPNRSLWRYSKKGAAYGKNVSIVATGSVTKTWTVANGANRTEY